MTAAALPKEHGNEHAAVVQAAPSWEVALRVRLHVSSPAVLSALGTLLTKSGQAGRNIARKRRFFATGTVTA